MSKTFTEQLRVPPASNTWNADGEGMHSLFPLDLIRGLNNLATYVNPHLHYIQNSNSTSGQTGAFSEAYTGSARECFMAQFPILAPLWAVRAVWVAGAAARSDSPSSLTAVGFYLAADPYTGTAGLADGGDETSAGAFDTTNLTTGYGHRSVSVTVAAGSYNVADDSSTGITLTTSMLRPISTGAVGVNTKRLGYGIITATGGTSCIVQVYDFSVWFLPS